MEDKELWILIALFGGLFGFVFLVKYVMWSNDFRSKLRYLNNEIGNSVIGNVRNGVYGSPLYRLSAIGMTIDLR